MSAESAPEGITPLNDDLPSNARASVSTDQVDDQVVPGAHDVRHDQPSHSLAPELQVYEDAKLEGNYDSGAKKPDSTVSPSGIKQGSGQSPATQLNPAAAVFIGSATPLDPAAPAFIPMSQMSAGGDFENLRGVGQASNRVDSNHTLAHALAWQDTAAQGGVAPSYPIFQHFPVAHEVLPPPYPNYPGPLVRLVDLFFSRSY